MLELPQDCTFGVVPRCIAWHVLFGLLYPTLHMCILSACAMFAVHVTRCFLCYCRCQVWGPSYNDAVSLSPLTIYISSSPWWWYGAVCVLNVTITESRRPYIAMCGATVTDARVSFDWLVHELPPYFAFCTWAT